MKDFKKLFPSLIRNPEIIYFDSGSTTQKPKSVIDTINQYLEDSTSNVGRGNYTWTNKITEKIDAVREKVAAFINASSEEIIFTSGSTESINTVTYSWGLHNLKTGDEILYSPTDHSSNIYPWIYLKQNLSNFGIDINLIPYRINNTGEADTEDILSKISARTRLITVTHIHSVYGSKTTLEELHSKIPKDILLSFDCSQSVGHIPIDVKQIKADFVSFSGHKMFASTGIGILYINKKIHNQIHPFLLGGNSDITLENEIIKTNQNPVFLEAGTPNIVGILSLGSSIDFINKIGIKKIEKHLLDLTLYLIDNIKKIPQIEILPGVATCSCAVGYGIISFNISGISANDVGFILNSNHIFVRTGNHCLVEKDSSGDSVRVSLHIYNSKPEVDKFISILKEITKEN